MTDIKISNLNFQYADKVIFQNADFTALSNALKGSSNRTILSLLIKEIMIVNFCCCPNDIFLYLVVNNGCIFNS